MSLIVGLTGGVASGKSTVEAAFRELGVPVIDADQVAREVVAPGEPALDAIAQRFGRDIIAPDGNLDRRALRAIVFSDDQARRDLEGMIHPAIRDRLRAWRDALDAPYGILSAATLVENGMSALCDRLLVVDVEPERQRERVMARDGIDAAMAESMLAAQLDRRTRRDAAQDVLCNAGSVADLEAAVEELHAYYLALAAGTEDAGKRWHLCPDSPH